MTLVRIPISKKNRKKQWPKEKVQMDKQRSTKHTHKTKDRVTRIPLRTGGELRCSGRIDSSCSTSGTRRVNLVTNPVISRESGEDHEVFTTSGTYLWSFVTQIFHNGYGGDRKFSKWWLQLYQKESYFCGILYFKLDGIDAINEITKTSII
jgi:hypothetical protein